MIKMRVLKSIFVVALLVGVQTLSSANDPVTIDDKATLDKLRIELISLLNKADFSQFGKQNLKASIHFVINSKRKLKVIDVYGENENLRLLIEQKLDNHLVNSPGIRIGKNYVLPVRFELKA